jgi:uncharacterized protein (TIGR03083 family)
MELDCGQVRQGFKEQCQVFLDLVDETEDLSTPTGLGEWDCAALIGHASTAVEALFRWQSPPTDGGNEVNAATWLGVGDETTADMNADFSRRYAAKRTHQQIRDLIAAAVVKGNETVAVTEPDVTLMFPFGEIWARFDQGLASRVLELTVHGIDLASAIGSATDPSPVALGVVGAILDELLEGDRPADLGEDRAWVFAATGRAEHTDPRLPVMH